MASTTATLLSIAHEAIDTASELVRTSPPGDLTPKGDRDYASEVDYAVEREVRIFLRSRTPGITFVGEEENAKPDGIAEWWTLDPIDGTVNFAHGLPVWSVSIALETAGEITIGVVVAPVLGWWFEATAGGGARDGSGGALRVSRTPRLEQALLATGFPYDRATNPDNNLAEWEYLQRHAGACRRLGSASLDLCMVACGWLDGYWERQLQAWDLAAGALIAREAGATVTGLTGGPFDLYRGDVVAANDAIHGELVAALGRARSRP